LQATISAQLFFAIGSLENDGDYKMIDDLHVFTQQLNQAHLKDLRLKWMVLTDENHNTVFPTALTRGLLYTKS
jgi:hypothetical protein